MSEFTNTVQCMIGLLSDSNIQFVRMNVCVTDSHLSGVISIHTSPEEVSESIRFGTGDSEDKFSFITMQDMNKLWTAIRNDPNASLHMDIRPMAVLSLESETVLGGLKVEISGSELSAKAITDWLFGNKYKDTYLSVIPNMGISLMAIISRGKGYSVDNLSPVVKHQVKHKEKESPLGNMVKSLVDMGVGDTYEHRVIKPSEKQQTENKERKEKMRQMLNNMVDNDVAAMASTGVVHDSTGMTAYAEQGNMINVPGSQSITIPSDMGRVITDNHAARLQLRPTNLTAEGDTNDIISFSVATDDNRAAEIEKVDSEVIFGNS